MRVTTVTYLLPFPLEDDVPHVVRHLRARRDPVRVLNVGALVSDSVKPFQTYAAITDLEDHRRGAEPSFPRPVPQCGLDASSRSSSSCRRARAVQEFVRSLLFVDKRSRPLRNFGL